MKVETFLQQIFRNILQNGRMPNHVAIILDGNRRYATKRCLETVEGHKKGCKIFDPVIDWSILCGVKELTVYIFSIKNFARSPEAVSGIMGVIRDDIIRRLLETMENGKARYQYIGDWSLFPEDMKPLIATLMEKTRKNTQITVNFAFAYTGRNEVTLGVNALLNSLGNGALELQNVNEDLLSQTLQLYPLSRVDLMIRTGECRISKFLSWNIDENSIICFRDQFWSTFSYWDFLASIFHYQSSSFKAIEIPEKNAENDEMQNNYFLTHFKKKVWNKIMSNISKHTSVVM